MCVSVIVYNKMAYKKGLKRNYEEFTTYIGDDICRRLYAKDIISQNTMEKVVAKNEQKGLIKANEELWDNLLHCTEDQLQQVLEVLERHESKKYGGLVEKIKMDGGCTASGYTVQPAATPDITEEDRLDQVQLRELSGNISQEYRSIGISLGLGFDRLQQLEDDHRGHSVDRNMAMFMAWWKKTTTDKHTKLLQLKKALSTAGRNDLSGSILQKFNL